jgi:hypothetical protein
MSWNVFTEEAPENIDLMRLIKDKKRFFEECFLRFLLRNYVFLNPFSYSFTPMRMHFYSPDSEPKNISIKAPKKNPHNERKKRNCIPAVKFVAKFYLVYIKCHNMKNLKAFISLEARVLRRLRRKKITKSLVQFICSQLEQETRNIWVHFNMKCG